MVLGARYKQPPGKLYALAVFGSLFRPKPCCRRCDPNPTISSIRRWRATSRDARSWSGLWRYWVCRPALAWHLLEEFDGRHALAIEASELMNNLTPRGHQICVMFRTPLRANWRTCVGLTAKRVTPPRAAQGLSACPPTRTSRTRGHPEQPPCPWPGRPRKRPLDRRRPEGPSQ